MHYTPEHCLVNRGVPYFGVEKATFLKWLQHVSFKEPCSNSREGELELCGFLMCMEILLGTTVQKPYFLMIPL